MKIDYISDLHLESNNYLIPTWKKKPCKNIEFTSTQMNMLDSLITKTKQSDILVVAGDIAHYTESAVRYLTRAADFYEHVLFVPGNHEYYETDKTVMEMDDFFYLLFKDVDNIHFLPKEGPVIIDDVAFCGTSGWYDWNGRKMLHKKKK